MSLYENTINLKGNVGKDAEVKSTSNGTEFVVFTLATQSSYKNKATGEWINQDPDWHQIVCFGRAVEYAKALKAGDYCEVKGELRSSRYQTEEGDNRTSWEIRASSVKKLDRPSKN